MSSPFSGRNRSLALLCILAAAQAFAAEPPRAVHVSGLGLHFDAVMEDGSLWVWGANVYARSAVASGLSASTPLRVGTEEDWKLVAATDGVTLALKRDGSLWHWVPDPKGAVAGTRPVPKGPQRLFPGTAWRTIALDPTNGAGIRDDGTLWHLGADWIIQGGPSTVLDTSPSLLSADTDWVSLSVRARLAVALKADGTLWDWGFSACRATRPGERLKVFPPRQIGTDTDWTAATAGQSHFLAVKRDGSLWAWGCSRPAVLGLTDVPLQPREPSIPAPTRVGTGTAWRTVAAGDDISFGIQQDGSLWAWGENFSGQLGLGDRVTRTAPTRVGTGTNWVGVTVAVPGAEAQLAEVAVAAWQADGSVWVTGARHWDEAGGAVGPRMPVLEQIGEAGTWAAAVAQGSHSAGLLKSGAVWQWDGIGLRGQPHGPVAGGSRAWQALWLGKTPIVRKADGTLWSLPPRGEPRPVTGGNTWAHVAAHPYGGPVLGLKRDGTLWIIPPDWRKPPSLLPGGGRWRTVNFALAQPTEKGGIWQAVRADGTLWRLVHWIPEGDSPVDEDGNFLPKVGAWKRERIGTEKDWRQVPPSEGEHHYTALGVRADGTLWIWRCGESPHAPLPRQVGTHRTWQSAAAGGRHFAAIKADGTLWAWINDTSITLGGPSLRPTRIGTRNDWASVVAGAFHVLALTRDGTLFGWGNARGGQLGTENLFSEVFVRVGFK